MIEDIKLFIYIVDCGGFSEVSKASGLSLPTIGRRITALEDELGITLFYNDRRSMQLTREGRNIYNRLRGCIYQLNSQLEEIKHFKKQVSGDLTVILPPFFSVGVVVQNLPRFLETYDEINLKLLYSSADVSQLNVSFDLAYSYIIPRKTELVIKPVWEESIILCASKDYICNFGRPNTLDELINHRVCVPTNNQYSPLTRWNITNFKTNQSFIFNLSQYQLAIDLFHVMNQIGVLGKAICATSSTLVSPLIKNGQLINLFPELSIHAAILYVIRPNTYISRKVEVFRNFMLECARVFLKDRIDHNSTKL